MVIDEIVVIKYHDPIQHKLDALIVGISCVDNFGIPTKSNNTEPGSKFYCIREIPVLPVSVLMRIGFLIVV